MSIPSLEPSGFLPLGRFPCTLDELEAEFVDSPTFTGSATRSEVFADFLSVVGMLRAFDASLVERAWIGGSFVTNKPNPDDIDCLFILSGDRYEALPSNRKRNQVRRFNRKGWVRESLNLRVEAFVLIRVPFANPWEGDGVRAEARPYTQVRGAWDDWWLRTRTGEGPDEEPRVESAEPRRGYLEVTL